MNKGYNGWTNWETWNFMLHEGDSLEYVVFEDMTLEEIESTVWTHISFLAEALELEQVADITREFVQVGYDAVNVEEIAQSLYDNMHE